MSDVWVETVGYLGSALVVLSVTRTSILKLRLLGLAGSLVFLGYGALIRSLPVVLTNLAIIGLHLHFLGRLRSHRREYFRLIEVDADSRYLIEFLDFHHADIQLFQPGFSYRPSADQVRAFVLRDMIPAGVLIGSVLPGRVFRVELDFVIPRYRDLKVARFLFTRSRLFDDHDIDLIVAPRGSEAHNRYLTDVGFVQHPDGTFLLHRDRSGDVG